VQNNTLSYAQAVTGVPADAASNNNHNSTDITTQLTTFLGEFKIMFSQLLNTFSQLLNTFSQLLNMFSQLLNQNNMILSKLATVIHKLTQ
jgi:hypothetical protein